MKYIIYGLSSSRNPEEIRYIGQTMNTLCNRLSGHKSKARRNLYNSHKCNWIRKEEKEGFNIIIKELDTANEDTWVTKEKEYIKLFKSIGAKLVNSSEGGEKTMLGFKHTEESKLKMSLSRTGQKRKPHSDEAKDKMRQAAIRQHKRNGPNKGFMNRKHTDEAKLKIGLSSERKIDQYDKNNNFIRTWDSLKKAAESFGSLSGSIFSALSGRSKTAHKFIWKYHENK